MHQEKANASNRTMAQKTREKLAVETAPNGILVIDMIGQILVANHAMETLTGYGASELVVRSINTVTK